MDLTEKSDRPTSYPLIERHVRQPSEADLDLNRQNLISARGRTPTEMAIEVTRAGVNEEAIESTELRVLLAGLIERDD